MRILGLIITIAALLVAVGGNLSIMLDIPSAIIVIAGALGMLWFSGASVAGMLSAVFSSAATSEQLLAAARAWRLAAVYALAAGAIGTIIGYVIMLKNLDDPAGIGPGLAIGILTILYGLIVAFALCRPLAARLEDRAAA